MPVDQNQMVALLRFLQGAYSSFEVREPTVESWLTVLGRFEYEEVFRAVHALACKGGAWAPSPGDVAEHIKASQPRVGASDITLLPPDRSQEGPEAAAAADLKELRIGRWPETKEGWERELAKEGRLYLHHAGVFGPVTHYSIVNTEPIPYELRGQIARAAVRQNPGRWGRGEGADYVTEEVPL